MIKFLVDEETRDPSTLSSLLINQTHLHLREHEVQRQIQQEKLRLEQGERIRVEQLELVNGERNISNGERKNRNGSANSNRKIRTGRKKKKRDNII